MRSKRFSRLLLINKYDYLLFSTESSFEIFFGKEDGVFYKLLSESSIPAQEILADCQQLSQTHANGQRVMLKTRENVISFQKFQEEIDPDVQQTGKHKT